MMKREKQKDWFWWPQYEKPTGNKALKGLKNGGNYTVKQSLSDCFLMFCKLP